MTITDDYLDELEKLAEQAHGPGWKLIWHGNEKYPFPLSIHTDDDSTWIARDGTVSSVASARLMTASREAVPALIAEVRRLRVVLKRMAGQPTFDELSPDEIEQACFSDGYSYLVETARAALKGQDDE